MGTSTYSILFMIISKAFILGLTGGIIGFFIGSYVAEYFGKEIFRFTALNIKPVWSLFYFTIYNIPGFVDVEQLDSGSHCIQDRCSKNT